MATEENLDEIDIKILKLLQQNSRLTVKELAARVHLSPSPTFERQKRLEREGYRANHRPNYGVLQYHRRLRLPDQGVCPGHEGLSGLHAQYPGKYRLHRKPSQHHCDWRNQGFTLYPCESKQGEEELNQERMKENKY